MSEHGASNSDPVRTAPPGTPKPLWDDLMREEQARYALVAAQVGHKSHAKFCLDQLVMSLLKGQRRV